MGLKERVLYFNDGGLFSIEKKKVYSPKILKIKKDGATVFSKKKYPDWIYEASLWFEELRETINYLKRLERLLLKLGYDTNAKISDEYMNKLLKQ